MREKNCVPKTKLKWKPNNLRGKWR
jgi:hypothetical protein